ncbi:hypothetical protein [Hymenobacter ruricola]|uniref:Uncharacterized protein n=1 Tax=Hymenobacter ruricola TaxID=2791023 RepID=A0ABS0I0W5_9BACT|nr:hypothetical protein [Hymenobacter ruricola]MBF9220537.1 hypothetical protein [Hymenobacter ruricola]
MATVTTPIPAAVKKDVLALLQQALDKLHPYTVTLTDAEQKSLASGAMGRESVPFVQEATKLLANYPQVLRRTITDEMIAEYPTWATTFADADELLTKTQALAALLGTVRLASGAQAMDLARDAYKDGQLDKGKTPGVAEIDTMSKRFPTGPKTKTDTKK